MIIKLKDGTETTVTKEQAERAIEEMEGGATSFMVNDMWIRCDWVAVIKPGGQTEADVIWDDSHILDRPDHRGKPSPAKEILREKYGKGI